MENLTLGFGTMLICLIVQASLVVLAVQLYTRGRALVNTPTFVGSFILIGGIMMVLTIGNILQIAIWASLFIYLDEFNDFAIAVYHSAVNFSTLGYGDIVMSDAHRALGPMQAINGVLMIGVSTSVVMSALQNSIKLTLGARKST